MTYDFDDNRMFRAIPFPFIEEIKRESVNLLSGHDGINIWTIPLHHQLGLCARHRAPSLHPLWNKKVDQYNMAAVPIDSPQRSTDAPTKTSVAQFYDVNRRFSGRVTPESFLDDFALYQPPTRAFRTFPYLTGINDHQAWKEGTPHHLNTVLLGSSPFNLCSFMPGNTHSRASWPPAGTARRPTAISERLWSSCLPLP
jgi:hypothetical protein